MVLGSVLWGPALAADYHVAVGSCRHGGGAGSDSNDGRSRATAFLTVQKCLDAMRGSDTCAIHSGTYIGDFNCCGNGNTSIESVVGTADRPTRILGAPGDSVRLQGTTSQVHPDKEVHAYETNLATLTIRAERFAVFPRFVEVGNLTINPGNGPALAMPRVHGYWVHDITVDDFSQYTPPSGRSEEAELFANEGTGIIWLWYGVNGLVENVRISNNGSVRLAHAFQVEQANDVRLRNLDVRDIFGGLNVGHGSNNTTWEFVKLRNWIPYYGDDGGLIHLYNNTASTVRWVSAVEKADPGRVTWYAMGTRRTQGSDCTNTAGPNSAYFLNNTLEGDGNDADSALGMSEWQYGGVMKCVNDWRAYNNVLEGWRNGILLKGNPRTLRDVCSMTTFAHNAYARLDGAKVLTEADGLCGFATRPEAGRVTCGGSVCTGDQLRESDHQPATDSPLVDAGSREMFGPTPWFPAPIGGGGAPDIGAYERGAGEWPYEFEIIGTVDKNPDAEGIKICWSTTETGCDVTIPLWDPSAQHAHNATFNRASGRVSNPDYYQVQVDPSSNFASGRPGAAPGFGAYYDSGTVASAAKFHVVPAGTLETGASYYVQLRVAEDPNYWDNSPRANSDMGNGGWGPWSVAFYRFQVGPPGSETSDPPQNVQGLTRRDI